MGEGREGDSGLLWPRSGREAAPTLHSHGPFPSLSYLHSSFLRVPSHHPVFFFFAQWPVPVCQCAAHFLYAAPIQQPELGEPKSDQTKQVQGDPLPPSPLPPSRPQSPRLPSKNKCKRRVAPAQSLPHSKKAAWPSPHTFSLPLLLPYKSPTQILLPYKLHSRNTHIPASAHLNLPPLPQLFLYLFKTRSGMLHDLFSTTLSFKSQFPRVMDRNCTCDRSSPTPRDPPIAARSCITALLLRRPAVA
nr:Phosphoinositide 3-kinase (PI3K) class III [Colletotrichum truncatum]KAF6781521.1 Phosphoinositide 3-kinase (PI3K) class III [Colletotrichum truncatum]